MGVVALSVPAVVGAIVLSYVLGCVPGALIVASRHGVDLRRTGDGNPGAWNALEQLGWARAWPAFLLDGAKGALAATIGWLVVGDWPWAGNGGLLRAGGALANPLPGHWLPWACVAAAMIGHAVPVGRAEPGGRLALRRGGKSVMTFAGGAVALVPLIGVPLVVAFIGIVVGAGAGRRGASSAWAARLSVAAFPAGQALVTPLVQVGWSGLLMSLIGLLFVVRR